MNKKMVMCGLILIIMASYIIYFFITNTEQEETIVLTDENFVEINNDIFTYPENYVGRKITYEGFMYYEQDYIVVARFNYCCGFDKYIIGLQCISDIQMPEEDEWVKVEGKIKMNYDELSDYYYPCLNVSKVEILQERGEEIIQ